MILTQEQKADLIAKVQENELGTDAKERILAILAQDELSAEDFAAVQDLIQADMDADLASMPEVAEISDPEYEERVAQINKELTQIEQDLKDVTAFVDEQGAALDGALGELEKGMEEMQLAEVRSNLGLG